MCAEDSLLSDVGDAVDFNLDIIVLVHFVQGHAQDDGSISATTEGVITNPYTRHIIFK